MHINFVMNEALQVEEPIDSEQDSDGGVMSHNLYLIL